MAISVRTASSAPGRFTVVAAIEVRSSPVGVGRPGGPGGRTSTNRVTASPLSCTPGREGLEPVVGRRPTGAHTAASHLAGGHLAAAAAVER